MTMPRGMSVEEYNAWQRERYAMRRASVRQQARKTFAQISQERREREAQKREELARELQRVRRSRLIPNEERAR